MDYRDVIKSEFQNRRVRNRRFTLRAFAKTLNLDSGSLSAIIRGKRKLPKTHWTLLAEQLRLSGRRRTGFFKSLSQEQRLAHLDFVEGTRSKTVIAEHTYIQITTEWEYFVTLCLMDLKKFKLTSQALAEVLGVSLARADEVITVLARSGFIVLRGGDFKKVHRDLTTTEDRASKVLQISHGNDLRLAAEKLGALNHLEREFTSVILAAGHRDLPKMKSWLRKMRDDFENLFEDSNGDQVFQLNIQMFPVTNRIQK